MTPTQLHRFLVERLTTFPRAGGVVGLDDAEPQTRLILNAADEVSGVLDNQDLGQVLVLPSAPILPAKRAMIDEELEDLDRPDRVLILAWRTAPDPDLAAHLAHCLRGKVAAAVVATGPRSLLPEPLADLFPTWVTLTS